MKPALWGPGLWDLMFSITWNCRAANFEKLLHVIMHDVPLLLPCDKCREHYTNNYATLMRRRGTPKDVDATFEWLYYLKDEVNKKTHTRSIALVDLRDRFKLSGAFTNDVLVADTLILLAIFADKNNNEDVFIDFCHNVHKLLPLPDDSQLLKSLARVRRPIVSHAYRACKNTRIEHGLKYPRLAHIRSVAE